MVNTYKFYSEWSDYPHALKQFNIYRKDVEFLHTSKIKVIRFYKPFCGYWIFEYELVKGE